MMAHPDKKTHREKKKETERAEEASVQTELTNCYFIYALLTLIHLLLVSTLSNKSWGY